jgi:hypothetical protein
MALQAPPNWLVFTPTCRATVPANVSRALQFAEPGSARHPAEEQGAWTSSTSSCTGSPSGEMGNRPQRCTRLWIPLGCCLMLDHDDAATIDAWVFDGNWS